jgi:hypothetical protein
MVGVIELPVRDHVDEALEVGALELVMEYIAEIASAELVRLRHPLRRCTRW